MNSSFVRKKEPMADRSWRMVRKEEYVSVLPEIRY